MTVTAELLSTYRWHRDEIAAGRRPPSSNSFQWTAAYEALHRRAPALMALKQAKADLEAGKRRHWSKPLNQRVNGFWKGRGTDKMQWIESPADIGLRFVGYADKIVTLDHEGWYRDEDCGDVIRGVVYRLPGRNGRAQFVAGYDDPDNEGTAAIDWSTVYVGERSDYGTDASESEAARDAARRADSLAEETAGEQRDYDRAWQAGSMWARLGEEIGELRTELKAMLAERRAAKAAMDTAFLPTICEQIRDFIEDKLEEVAEKRKERADLADGDYDKGRLYLGFYTGDAELRHAFNDGAGEVVLA